MSESRIEPKTVTGGTQPNDTQQRRGVRECFVRVDASALFISLPFLLRSFLLVPNLFLSILLTCHRQETACAV
jgi:hypothetical protein